MLWMCVLVRVHKLWLNCAAANHRDERRALAAQFDQGLSELLLKAGFEATTQVRGSIKRALSRVHDGAGGLYCGNCLGCFSIGNNVS